MTSEKSRTTGRAAFLANSNLRKAVLTTHLITSLGWLGAVAGFVALDITAVTDMNAQIFSAAYLCMALITRWVIVPLALVALLTGLIQAMGTPWGLFRHYWVLAKLALTLVATIVLLQKVAPINYAAAQAGKPQASLVALQALGRPLAVHSVGGLVVLLAITTISVYKPWGLTPYGRQRLREPGIGSISGSSKPVRPWAYLIVIAVFLLLLAAQHLRHAAGAILGHHGH